MTMRIKFLLLNLTIALAAFRRGVGVDAFSGLNIQTSRSPQVLSQRASPFSIPSLQARSNKDVSNNDEDATGNGFSVDPLYGGLWLAFLVYGIALSPGEVFDPLDTNIIQAYIDNPSAPQGINQLFLAIFNGLGIMPLVLSQLACPQGRREGIPGGPLLAAAAGMGYGAAGLYLTFRAPPVDTKTRSEASWITRNVLESKLVNGGIVLLCLFVAAQAGITPDTLPEVLSGFGALASQSKLVSVSSLDLAILTIVAATLIPRDYSLRVDDVEATNAKYIAASTVLLPILGAALYCAWRPSLPEE